MLTSSTSKNLFIFLLLSLRICWLVILGSLFLIALVAAGHGETDIFWAVLILGLPTVWLIKKWQKQTKFLLSLILIISFIACQIYSGTPSGKAAYASYQRSNIAREQKEAQEAKQRQVAEQTAATERAKQNKIAVAEKARQDKVAATEKAKQGAIAAAAKAKSDKDAAVAQKQKEDQEAKQRLIAGQAAREQVAQAQAKALQQNEQQAKENEKEADANYCKKVLDIDTQLTECVQTLHDLFSDPKFDDGDWKMSVVASLAVMNKLSIDGQAISCPARFQSAQNYYSAALNEYEKASDDLPRALDNQDTDKMEECASRITHGSELMKSATQKIERTSGN